MLLLSPLALAIDHGNPQINFLSLSFFLVAIRFALSSNFVVSAPFALLAVLSKITALSCILPFPVFVLAHLYHSKASLLKSLLYLLAIAGAVLSLFLLLHYPLLASGTFDAMMSRVFPYHRILIEQVLPNFTWLISFIFQL